MAEPGLGDFQLAKLAFLACEIVVETHRARRGTVHGNLRLPSGFHRQMKIPLFLTLCAAALLSTPVFAEESDPLRGKIKELEERARTAKEQGRADESKELMQQVRRLHAEMIERGDGDKLERAKRQIEALHKAGKHEEAAQLERRLRGAKQHSGDHERQESGSEAERKQHAMEAIKHLHAAGLHEPAERIEQILREHKKEAGQDSREKGERRGSEGVNPREGQEQMQRVMHDMQEQTQRAMREMQEQTQRALRDTHEQMARMARTIEELREQVARPRGNGERRKD